MMIHDITAMVGPHKRRKRVGRGIGSGHGKTAGRGHKGAHSRAGYSYRVGDEGGQMPLFRRLPKRGFSNAQFRAVYNIINIRALDARFGDGAHINPDTLVQVGLIHNTKVPIKILGHGRTSKKLFVTAAAFSKAAATQITEAGGTITVAS